MRFELTIIATDNFKIKHSFCIKADNMIKLLAQLPLSIARMITDMQEDEKRLEDDDDIPF